MLMGMHLQTIGHPLAEALLGLEQQRMSLVWQTSGDAEDSGVYTIRCMETFMGEMKSWKPGFDLNTLKRKVQITDLRAKYVFKLVHSPLNEMKNDVTNHFTKYWSIPDDVRSDMLEQARVTRWERLNPYEEKHG
jgi:hypothetical protein